MKVKRNTLLLLACLVWSVAGFTILRIGLASYGAYVSITNLLLSGVVFLLFQKFVFGRLVRKHTARIASYWEERHFFMKFFDTKAFVIMAVMMTGGITLRFSGWAPERCSSLFFIQAWEPRYCWPECCLAATTAGRPWLPGGQNRKENKTCRQSSKHCLMPSI